MSRSSRSRFRSCTRSGDAKLRRASSPAEGVDRGVAAAGHGATADGRMSVPGRGHSISVGASGIVPVIDCRSRPCAQSCCSDHTLSRDGGVSHIAAAGTGFRQATRVPPSRGLTPPGGDIDWPRQWIDARCGPAASRNFQCF